MGYKHEFARRVYDAFEELRAAARKKRKPYGQKELGADVAKILRQPKAFKQPVVSAWMNVSKPSVPDVPTQKAIAEALGVNEDWLVLFKGPMHPPADSELKISRASTSTKLQDDPPATKQAKAGRSR